MKWEYRIKIAMGILEFFLDSSIFNPNDEFGMDSLHLCSPIEDSFGYTFFMEGKLLNYDHLMSGRDLVQKLDRIHCTQDSDCIYTKNCVTKCIANKCSHHMSRPQIVNYCAFLRRFLAGTDAVKTLEPMLEKCARMETVYLRESLVYEKNEMPLSFEKHKNYLERSAFWNKSIENTMLIDDLRRTMWNLIKLVEDPKKKKKT
jgi:hypothetical protein